VRSAPADKVDDFDPIALAERRSAEGRSFQDHEVVLNGYTSWVDLQPGQQLRDSQRTADLDALAVDHDQHAISPARPGAMCASAYRAPSAAVKAQAHATPAFSRSMVTAVCASAPTEPRTFTRPRCSESLHTQPRQGKLDRGENAMLTATGHDVSAALMYRRNRERSRAIFGLLNERTYYSQPIPLRHPIVFYEGHLPAFSFNTLVKKALGRPSIDTWLETLFARGIDPADSEAPLGPDAIIEKNQRAWPSRALVRQFAEEADRQVLAALEHAELDRPGHPLLDHGEAVHAILEHEAMHQETLLYMWHRLPFDVKRRPHDYMPRVDGQAPPSEWVEVPGGHVTLGVDRGSIPFGWDNEFQACSAEVSSFSIERFDVTNARFLEFVDAGGYTDQRWWRPDDWKWITADSVRHPLFWERQGDGWWWHGMFELVPLPPSWPVFVSQAEADAFARWAGARLPTEAEFQRAAFGTPEGDERRHSWGDAEPDPARGVFDFSSWDPEPTGSHHAGASAWGIEDLVGNGWEWTATPFAPFKGFRPMASYPEYSADFFDGEHFVMKGASPATARGLLRPTFRNWFRPRYPYVYATFRCVKNGR
jgi:gamma-glutamyl hercynylcysteine S-oxide synthase